MLEKITILLIHIGVIIQVFMDNIGFAEVAIICMLGFIYLNVKDKGQVIELEITKEDE